MGIVIRNHRRRTSDNFYKVFTTTSNKSPFSFLGSPLVFPTGTKLKIVKNGLTVYYQDVTSSIDLSFNTLNESLDFYINEDILTVSNAFNYRDRKLTYLDVSRFNIIDLDLKTNPDLNNIDLTNNISLEELDFNNVGLTSLDISQNTALEFIQMYNTNIDTLDASNLTNLVTLSFFLNGATSVNTTNCTSLSTVNFDDNNLVTVDFSTNNNLVNAYCQKNNLSNINTSNCNLLDRLWVSLNNLNSLDVSTNTNLTDLRLYNNNITTLDISNNPLITVLSCYNNPLTQNALLDIATNLDNFGLSNGVLSAGNTATINTAIQTKIDSLIAKGWTVTT